MCDGTVVYGRRYVSGTTTATYEQMMQLTTADSTTKSVSGSIQCSNDNPGGMGSDQFQGGDPAADEYKQCFCQPDTGEALACQTSFSLPCLPMPAFVCLPCCVPASVAQATAAGKADPLPASPWGRWRVTQVKWRVQRLTFCFVPVAETIMCMCMAPTRPNQAPPHILRCN